MKRSLVLFLFYLLGKFCFASSDTGIQFTTGSWAEVTNLAKKTNKLIFIDCYTSWCGPCKQLSAEIFPQKEVGDLFNMHFINFKVDMEKGEGPKLQQLFHVGAYPTLLWVDHTGRIIQRSVGFVKVEALLAEAQKALKGGDYNNIVEAQYHKNPKDIKLVKDYLDVLRSRADSRETAVSQQYLDLLPASQYLVRENFALFSSKCRDPFSSIFQYVANNREAANNKIGKPQVDEAFNNICNSYAGMLVQANKDGKPFDKKAFQQLVALMDNLQLETRAEIIGKTHIRIAQYKKDWKSYVDHIKTMIDDGIYNKISQHQYSLWYTPIVESNCTDAEVLTVAVDWIDQIIAIDQSFSMPLYKNHWANKVKLLERMENHTESLAQAKIELTLIELFCHKQEDANKLLAERIKLLTSFNRN